MEAALKAGTPTFEQKRRKQKMLQKALENLADGLQRKIYAAKSVLHILGVLSAYTPYHKAVVVGADLRKFPSGTVKAFVRFKRLLEMSRSAQ